MIKETKTKQIAEAQPDRPREDKDERIPDRIIKDGKVIER